jgi:hypothetical protein
MVVPPDETELSLPPGEGRGEGAEIRPAGAPS